MDCPCTITTHIVLLYLFICFLNVLFVPRQDILYLADPHAVSQYECQPPTVPPSLPLQLHSSSRKRQRSLLQHVPLRLRTYVDRINEHGSPLISSLNTKEFTWLRTDVREVMGVEKALKPFKNTFIMEASDIDVPVNRNGKCWSALVNVVS